MIKKENAFKFVWQNIFQPITYYMIVASVVVFGFHLFYMIVIVIWCVLWDMSEISIPGWGFVILDLMVHRRRFVRL